MRILLTGATGFIGQHLLSALLLAGHQVTICCRKPEKIIQQSPNISIHQINFEAMTNPEDWQPFLQSIDAVINCVGIIKETDSGSFEVLHHLVPCALFRACDRMSIKKVVQISALGAELDASTDYFISKAKADKLLRTLDINWYIFKPSVIFGHGAKSMALFRALAALPITPILADGQQLLQPVALADLQQAVLLALDPNTPSQQMIAAVGPEPMTFVSLLQDLAQQLGRKLKPWPIPQAWFKVLLPLFGCLDEPIMNKQSLTMLQQGNSAEPKQFANFLGHHPCSLAQFLHSTPPSQAERWHARLYFLRPLLNLSIALVWLWTGWISAFVYPVADSVQMLYRVGISSWLAPWVLYSAALADFLLGIALLFRWRLRLTVALQIGIMLAYSVVITVYLPEFWLHPFGPLIKNLPFFTATLILLILEEEQP